MAVRSHDRVRAPETRLQRLPHAAALTRTPGWWYDVFLREIARERTDDDVAFLARVLPPPPARVLDVACGFGRHMRGVTALGYVCTGVELNDEVASEARASGLDVRTLDMRELDSLSGRFDAVISMWASVGGFDDETNARVFRLLAAKVAPGAWAALPPTLPASGGVLVLEVFNREFFEPRQGPFEIREGIVETKRVEGDRLYVEYDRGGAFEWRLYEPEELAALTGFTLGSVERSTETARMRVVLHASPASSGASAAAPMTNDATVR